jgi:hypothetical protein
MRLAGASLFTSGKNAFKTAESRKARDTGYDRRSIGESIPRISIAHLTPAAEVSQGIPKARCHNDIGLFFVGSVAETV